MHPIPLDEQIRKLLGKHNLPVAPIEESPHEGSVNYVRMVGDLCIRILKVEDYASDIFTEAVAVPAVREAGADVPELLVFDQDRDIFPGLVSIYRRFPGEPLGQCQYDLNLSEVYREVGEQIARWSSRVAEINDPNQWLDKPNLDNAWECLERNGDRISLYERGWFEATITRLDQAKAEEPIFVHWDLHPHNILVHEGRFVAVIDWGDAGWGDAAINYHCLPASMLPTLFESLEDASHELIGRCLYATLAYALNDIHRPEDASHPYRNSGDRRWNSFQELYNQDLSESWRHWLGDHPPG